MPQRGLNDRQLAFLLAIFTVRWPSRDDITLR
jgi:hypothetical protein